MQKKIILLALLYGFPCMAYSQTGNGIPAGRKDSLFSVQLKKDDEGKDIGDYIRRVHFIHSLSGKPDTIPKAKGKVYASVIPAAGFSLHTNFAFTVGANAAFYTDDPQKVNLSVINTGPYITSKHQFIAPIQSNIWLNDNKYNLFGNWIFYKLPEYTYGLGGHSALLNATGLDYDLILIRETALRSITPDFFIGLGYNLDYHWNIVESRPDAGETDFDKYGFKKFSRSSGITYNLLFDNIKNALNPEGGYFANIIYRTNYTVFGSDQNWQSILLDLRKYIQLSPNSSNILAIWSYTWMIVSGKPPYLDLPATAWDTYANQGRGYIQGRFRSNILVDLEAEYRFKIMANGLLGGVIFGNVQSPAEWPSNKLDVLWPGGGVGLRVKINKHSNTNIAIDYGFGAGGSHGFFTNLGEVF